MKWIVNVLMACCAGSVTAQQTSVRLEGNLGVKPDSNFLHLKHYDGLDVKVPVNAKGQFNTIMPDIAPGFYTFDQIGVLYLKPGAQVKISMRKDSSYAYGNAANDTLAAIKRSVGRYLPYNKEGLTQEAFYMDAPAFLKQLKAIEDQAALSIAAVKDPFFATIATKDFHYYCKTILQSYSSNYGIDQGKKAQYTRLRNGTEKGDQQAAYRSMFVKRIDSVTRQQLVNWQFDDIDMNDAVLLRQSALYRRAMEQKISYNVNYVNKYHLSFKDRSKEAKAALRKQVAQDLVTDTLLLAYFNYQYTEDVMKIADRPGQLDSLYKGFMAAAGATPAQKAAIQAIYKNRQSFGDNQPAPDFTYNNVEGKPVTLSSLRGKYVYIDVWATWCGPCKAQIPYLTKVEEAYHGKNIQFVSLSIDNPEDKGKWIEYVTAHKLQGIQVMADNAIHSAFIQKFSIDVIPRFILIDPQGKIVSGNAKRPSDPELRKQLDTIL